MIFYKIGKINGTGLQFNIFGTKRFSIWKLGQTGIVRYNNMQMPSLLNWLFNFKTYFSLGALPHEMMYFFIIRFKNGRMEKIKKRVE